MPEYGLSISYADAFERRGNLSRTIVALDNIAAMTLAGVVVGAMANIMDADILSYSVSTDVVYTDTVVAGANKDVGITLSCDLGGGKRAALKIPTPALSVVNGDGSVDMTDALITALESEYIAGNILISDGETVVRFISGKLDK